MYVCMYVIRQRADLFEANISANKISLPQGQSYTERYYCNGPYIFQSLYCIIIYLSIMLSIVFIFSLSLTSHVNFNSNFRNRFSIPS